MRRGFRALWVLPWILSAYGCRGPSQAGRDRGRAVGGESPGPFRGIRFERAVEQRAQGRQGRGSVVQNPLRMGELGVRTMVDCLEKKKVDPRCRHGRDAGDPREHDRADDRRTVKPPQGRERQRRKPFGGVKKEVAGLVIPKGTTHEFWKTIHSVEEAADELGTVDLIWQGPAKEDDRLQQIQLVQNADRREGGRDRARPARLGARQACGGGGCQGDSRRHHRFRAGFLGHQQLRCDGQ